MRIIPDYNNAYQTQRQQAFGLKTKSLPVKHQKKTIITSPNPSFEELQQVIIELEAGIERGEITPENLIAKIHERFQIEK